MLTGTWFLSFHLYFFFIGSTLKEKSLPSLSQDGSGSSPHVSSRFKFTCGRVASSLLYLSASELATRANEKVML